MIRDHDITFLFLHTTDVDVDSLTVWLHLKLCQSKQKSFKLCDIVMVWL